MSHTIRREHVPRHAAQEEPAAPDANRSATDRDTIDLRDAGYDPRRLQGEPGPTSLEEAAMIVTPEGFHARAPEYLPAVDVDPEFGDSF